MRVKICGLRSAEAALYAAEQGADALGFIFAESRRCISPEQASEIISKLPPFITTVGVFLNESPEDINFVLDQTRCDYVQLHGQQPIDQIKRINAKIIKTIPMLPSTKPEDYVKFRGHVSGFLLDTSHQGSTGGTGRTFEWSQGKKFQKLGALIVAGGLNPENVSQAIEQTQPFGVDVSSGVETKGIKDLDKIKNFIKRAKSQDI